MFVLPTPPTWHADAACCRRENSTVDFFATHKAGQSAALAVCGTCRAMAACRAEAIADPSLDFGIRGGMTAPARRLARRSRTTRPEEVTNAQA